MILSQRDAPTPGAITREAGHNTGHAINGIWREYNGLHANTRNQQDR